MRSTRQMSPTKWKYTRTSGTSGNDLFQRNGGPRTGNLIVGARPFTQIEQQASNDLCGSGRLITKLIKRSLCLGGELHTAHTQQSLTRGSSNEP